MSLNGASPISAFAMYNKRKKRQPVNSVHPAPHSAKKFKIAEYTAEPMNKGIAKKSVKLPVKEILGSKKLKSNGIMKNKIPIKSEKFLKKKRKVKLDVDEVYNPADEEPPTLVPIHLDIKTSKECNQIKSSFNKTDPTIDGLKMFKWMIAPIKPRIFFEKYWENRILYINRNDPSYYKDILTTKRLDDIFREFPLHYTRNVDVVSYEDGIKQVHNEEGKVSAPALYDYYNTGCSIRVLNPQTYDRKVYLLIATLQEYFGSMVGTNVYLTPPGSQGFAPHYDDIEAFILQLEGRKHWKLYKPTGKDILARYSSPNFKREDLGEPYIEVTLNAGDILYFPRGTIHEGRTDQELHSLHITVSVYQRNSYADLLEHILPDALEKAASEDINFRKGLPLNYLKHLGFVNGDKKSEDRQIVQNQVKKLIESLSSFVDVDKAADKLGRKFIYDSMPPVLSKEEAQCSSKYDGDFLKNGKIFNRVEIEMDTEVRLLRYHCLRVVLEDDAKIYYNTDNAKFYHGEEEQFLIIDSDLLPCIKKLQNSYPKYIGVENLPGDDDIKKAQLVSDLWERGLLVTNGQLNQISDEESEEVEDGVLSDDSSF